MRTSRLAVSAGLLASALCAVSAFAQPRIQINEVSISPGIEAQWVELYNAAAGPRTLAGYIVSNEGPLLYTIPVALPAVPPGAFVLIRFDGLGSGADDYDFGDNVAELHAPDLDPFDPIVDQVALYDDSGVFDETTIQAFVAWGLEPGPEAANAVLAGLWPGEDTTVNVQIAEPIEGPAAELVPDGTIGVYGSYGLVQRDDWVAYAPVDASPGAENGPPVPVLYLPGDGLITGETAPTFSWTAVPGASMYHFQLDDDAGFGSPDIDDPNVPHGAYDSAPLPDGTYYWRVRCYDTYGVLGPWSAGREISTGWSAEPAPAPPATPPGGDRAGFTLSGRVTDDLNGRGLAGVTIQVGVGGPTVTTDANGNWSISDIPSGPTVVMASRNGYTTDQQNVNVTGDTSGINFSLDGQSKVLGVPSLAARKDGNLLCIDRCNEYPHEIDRGEGNHHWDGSHTARAKWGTHERMYCTPTAAAMLARYRGGDVYIEEISYDIWKGGGPEQDLGHNRGHNLARQQQSLEFALQCGAAQLHYTTTQPTGAELIAYIEADRPIRYSSGAHAMVVSGYKWINGRLCAWFLNTDNNGRARWYYWRGAGAQNFSHCWIPDAGLTGRNKDPRVELDGDGDGIMDFDEDERFDSLKTDDDSDLDQVKDKNDIKNYTFHFKYCARHSGALPQALYDIDGDGNMSELDCDSDNDADFDGGEDTDGDGHNPDYSETCMFYVPEKEIVVNVDRTVYYVGQPVYIIDNDSRRTRTYHYFSTYNYELGAGCPNKNDGDTVRHDKQFSTDVWGKAHKTLVHVCPSPGLYYLNVDVLDDGLYSEPDNWDPLTCWVCINVVTPPYPTPTPAPPSYPVPTPYPTPPCTPTTPTSLDGTPSTGPIQLYEWRNQRYLLAQTETAYTEQYLPPGTHWITLTVHAEYDGDWVSETAEPFPVTVEYDTGPVPLPVDIPLSQQINPHPLLEPQFDAITAGTDNPPPQFVDDGVNQFTRMQIYSGRFEGPYVDLGLACYGPMDVTPPGTVLRFTARYHQDVNGNSAPYWDAPINVRLLDEDGHYAELGTLYGPQPELPYPEWMTVEKDIMAFEIADELFDPTRVIRVEFYGDDWFLEGSGDFVDIRDLYIGPSNEWLVGDMNCNGVVGFDDINPFVTALVEGEAGYNAQYPGCNWYNADINQNGVVGFDDINPFVALLTTNPNPIACP